MIRPPTLLHFFRAPKTFKIQNVFQLFDPVCTTKVLKTDEIDNYRVEIMTAARFTRARSTFQYFVTIFY